MKRLFAVASLSAAMALTPMASALSAPLSVPSAPAPAAASSDVQKVQHRRGGGGGRHFHRRGGRYYYGGHRGYRHRPGRHYRRHNGFWFPLAAFGIGAAIASQSQPRVIYRDAPRRGGLSNAHYRWCENRYRSYRAYDNTFQPYNGPRRQCYSPYS